MSFLSVLRLLRLGVPRFNVVSAQAGRLRYGNPSHACYGNPSHAGRVRHGDPFRRGSEGDLSAQAGRLRYGNPSHARHGDPLRPGSAGVSPASVVRRGVVSIPFALARMVRRVPACGVFLLNAVVMAADAPLELTWPTPSTAWSRGQSIEAFVQHAGSGDPESGTFGGVRSGGQQFHEGLDIRSHARDRRGQPLDEIYAAMDGVVRHVSRKSGESSYGRYVVIEHPDHSPAVYTLYAHLASVAADVRVGSPVRRGHVLGIMGNSADKPFPRERAHLHFEIGLMVTQNFQRWYDRRKFGSRNEQGVWNGMNLMGLDPLWVFNGWKQGQFRSMQDVFRSLPPAVRLRIATHQSPDFIRRYPSLLTRPLPMGPVAGWEITFSWTGLPFAWTPLTAMEVAGLVREKPIITWVDAALEKRERSKTLVVSRRGQWHTARDLETVLQQLFGMK